MEEKSRSNRPRINGSDQPKSLQSCWRDGQAGGFFLIILFFVFFVVVFFWGGPWPLITRSRNGNLFFFFGGGPWPPYQNVHPKCNHPILLLLLLLLYNAKYIYTRYLLFILEFNKFNLFFSFQDLTLVNKINLKKYISS
jgi:hypothetical protein